MFNFIYYQQRGFSLLELLIISSLISLLAIILVPNLIETKNIAHQEEKQQQVTHKLNKLKLSLENFHFNSGYYPVYNLSVPDKPSLDYGNLEDIMDNYPALNKLIDFTINDPDNYYYYAPANIKFSPEKPYQPSRQILKDEPSKGANYFIIIYNGQSNYYKITSYSSDIITKQKEKPKQINKKRLNELFNL
ncbi:MAG: prepilin-type N-terminal cleavage/methylation domain-containing protein [Bacillota bacterium]